MVLLFLLGLAAVSSTARADFGANIGKDAVADFCSDPYVAICGDNDEIGKQYDDRFARMKLGIHDEAEREEAAKYGYSPADDSGYDGYAKAHPEAAQRMLEDFVAYIRTGAMQAVGPDPLKWQLGIEGRLTRELLAVVDGQARLSQAQKADFKSALGELEVVDAGAIIASGEAHPLWPNFVYQCKENGLRDNAFHPPGMQKIVLCPGLILASRMDSDLTADRQDMFAGVVWTMSHETGHSIDYEHFPAQYVAMRSCVEQEFIRTGILKGFENLAPGSADYEDRIEAHMEEIAADHWANEVMAKLIEGMTDRAQGLALLKSATVGLCGLRDDGVRYGSDRFRLGVLLGRNPRLRKALGCGPLESGQASCDFAGQVGEL